MAHCDMRELTMNELDAVSGGEVMAQGTNACPWFHQHPRRADHAVGEVDAEVSTVSRVVESLGLEWPRCLARAWLIAMPPAPLGRGRTGEGDSGPVLKS